MGMQGHNYVRGHIRAGEGVIFIYGVKSAVKNWEIIRGGGANSLLMESCSDFYGWSG